MTVEFDPNEMFNIFGISPDKAYRNRLGLIGGLDVFDEAVAYKRVHYGDASQECADEMARYYEKILGHEKLQGKNVQKDDIDAAFLFRDQLDRLFRERQSHDVEGF